MSDPAPNPGQIWRENDPRQERFVRVISVHGDEVKIQTVDQAGWPKRGSRVSSANLCRFGGPAREKYGFVREGEDKWNKIVENPSNLFQDQIAFHQSHQVERLAAENERLRCALDRIAKMHKGDQPAAMNVSELEWANRHILHMRIAAREALENNR